MSISESIDSALVNRLWRESVLPMLCDYVRIPNKSPAFDRDWAVNGYLDEAAALLERWCNAQPVRGMHCEIVRSPGRTPLLYIEVAGRSDDTILFYGHFDKQPECGPWDDGLSPWEPALRGGRLYGRGAADDGYAVCAALTAIAAVQARVEGHARCVILIEGCEESGSADLPHYIEMLGARIGQPSLVICLDAECANYEQLWCTTSLRGLLSGTLRVATLRSGAHSGSAGGIAPTPFGIARHLLSRLESEETGEMLVNALHVEVPQERRHEAEAMARVLGDAVADRVITLLDGVRPLDGEPVELLLRNTWRPAMAIIGADGLPPINGAGNVLLPDLALRLSFRLPPTVDAVAAASAITAALESDPPYGAHVRFDLGDAISGWQALPMEAWLVESLDRGSRRFFGGEAMYMGAGSTIPVIRILATRFPTTQFVIAGVVGPQANAHGPNECLHIDAAINVTLCVAQVIADHSSRARRPEAGSSAKEILLERHERLVDPATTARQLID